MTSTIVTMETTAGHSAGFLRRVGLAAAALAAVLAVGFLGWGAVARVSLAQAHPPPGQFIDVGGYRLHLNCIGEGNGPTVLLEAGNADFGLMWAAVQPALAEEMKVCAYDRAGLGWSERGSAPRTLGMMTEELGRLLTGAGIEGNVLIVGHSFGGVLARSFAAEYPERVAGLVLVDPAHEDQLELGPTMRESVSQGKAQFESLVPLATWNLLAMLPQSIPNRGLPDAAYQSYAALLATTNYFAVAAEETAMLPANLEAMKGIRGDLGDLPLVVVSRSSADSEAQNADEAGWISLQAEIARLSTDSRHVVATHSGHYVQLDQPELVVAAVQEVLARL